MPFVAVIFGSDADAIFCPNALERGCGSTGSRQKGNFILCSECVELAVAVAAIYNGIECAPLDVEGAGLPVETDELMPPDDSLVEIEGSDAVADTEWQGMRIEDPETGAPCPAFAQRISAVLNDKGIPCVAVGGDVAFPREAEAEVMSAIESGFDVAIVLDGFGMDPARGNRASGKIPRQSLPSKRTIGNRFGKLSVSILRRVRLEMIKGGAEGTGFKAIH